jgi:hypothetical protein
LIVLLVACLVLLSANLENANRAYQNSLSKLKTDPHNPDLRQHTLNLGRQYAAAARSNGRVALFDEVALMNDINAACARVGSTQGLTPESGHRSQVDSPKSTVGDRLETLEALRLKSLISEEEYQSRRTEIIKEL